MTKYYLEDSETEEKVYHFEEFDKVAIKICIHNYFKFSNNKDKTLFFYKVCNSEKTVGDDFISCFVCRNEIVCKEIYRGTKTYYKPIKTN